MSSSHVAAEHGGDARMEVSTRFMNLCNARNSKPLDREGHTSYTTKQLTKALLHEGVWQRDSTDPRIP
jgi:hypothetical protein